VDRSTSAGDPLRTFYQLRSYCLAFLAVTPLWACGAKDRADAGFSVRDSAGVTIVEHGPLPERTAFMVGDPVYRVGWSSEDHEFARVSSGVLLSDGRAAIADGGSRQVVMLDGTGGVEAIIGGPGEGPREIGSLRSISRLPGDTIVVEDGLNRRFTVVHGGEVVRSYPRMSTTALTAIGVDGVALLMTTSSYQPFFEEPWLQFHVVRHTPDTERWDTIHGFDFAPKIVEGETPDPFRPYGSFAMTQGAVLVARGDRAQVEMVDPEGGIFRIVRWTEEPVAPTEAFWTAYSEYVVSQSGDFRESATQRLAESRSAVGEALPYVGRLQGDAVGRAWVSPYVPDYRHPARYRVFDATGEWRGWVDMPDRTEILDIGQDLILAIQRNELDVDAVALLPLHPPPQVQ